MSIQPTQSTQLTEPVLQPPSETSSTDEMYIREVKDILKEGLDLIRQLTHKKNNGRFPNEETPLSQSLQEHATELSTLFKKKFHSEIEHQDHWFPLFFGYSYGNIDNTSFSSDNDKANMLPYADFLKIRENPDSISSDSIDQLAHAVRRLYTLLDNQTLDLSQEETQKKLYSALFFGAKLTRFLVDNPTISHQVANAL